MYIPGISMCILNCKIISSYNRWSEPSRPDITSDNPYWSASTINCPSLNHKDAAEKGRIAYIKINDAGYADFQSNCVFALTNIQILSVLVQYTLFNPLRPITFVLLWPFLNSMLLVNERFLFFKTELTLASILWQASGSQAPHPRRCINFSHHHHTVQLSII